MTKRVSSESSAQQAKKKQPRASLPSVPYAELSLASFVDAETGCAVKPDKPFESVALQTPDDLSVMKIGRGSKNGLRLVHSKFNDLVSPEHAKIFVRSDGVHRIVDLGSHNGTYVNGNLIPMNQEWKLKNRDCVSFGGPSRVFIEDRTIMNPFCFVYYRLHSVEVWNKMRSRQEQGVEMISDAPEWLLAEVKCTICLETFENPHSVNKCGHVYCKACILHWFCKSDQCPTCKQKMEKCAFLALTPCPPIRNMAERVFSTYALDQVKERGDHVRSISVNLQKTILARRKAYEERVRDRMFSSGRRILLGSATAPSPLTRLSTETTTIQNGVRSGTTTPAADFLHVPDNESGEEHSIESIAWKVESAGVGHVARCARCGMCIPANLFRITRTARGTTQHFHPNVSCIDTLVSEMRHPGFDPKIEEGVSEQERRIATRLFEMVRTRRP